MAGRARRKKGRAAIWAAAVILLAAVCAAGLYAMRGRFSFRFSYPLKYTEYIKKSAEEYGLSPCFVAAVINTESGFDPEAVSVDGAVGLMQLLPSTAEWIAGMRGIKYDEDMLRSPEYNIDFGCWLLRYLLDRYDGSVRYAAVAYNAGHGRLESWLANSDYLDENGELAVIPFDETRNYVRRVERAAEEYKERYGEQLEKAGEGQ